MSTYKIIRNQTIAVAATSAACSNAFGEGVSAVRVSSTTNCHIRLGATPVAVTSDMYLPAGAVEFLAVQPGEKLAAIRTTTSGTLHVTEISA